MKVTKISVSLNEKVALARSLGGSYRFDNINPSISLEIDRDESMTLREQLQQAKDYVRTELELYTKEIIQAKLDERNEELVDEEDV